MTIDHILTMINTFWIAWILGKILAWIFIRIFVRRETRNYIKNYKLAKECFNELTEYGIISLPNNDWNIFCFDDRIILLDPDKNKFSHPLTKKDLVK